MKDKRTWLILALLLWLSVAILACQCGGPAPEEPPEAAQKEPPEAAPEEPPEAPPASDPDVLDDLPEELLLSVVRPKLKLKKAPDELPAVQVGDSTGNCYELKLWGFPFDEVVHVELYDPSGQLVAAHEETRERGRPDRGLKIIQISLGERPAGDWVVVVDSAGVSARKQLHVAEPGHPVMSIALEGAGPSFTTPNGCKRSAYARGDQVTLFGTGFPPARTLPLGIYESRQDSHGHWLPYRLVYRQAVRTDDHGRFEVHQAVRALVPEGDLAYFATVALDALDSIDDVGPSARFWVTSDTSTPSEEVILELAVDGGAFFDTRVQQAVLAAVNRSYLGDYFDGAPVTFLFSFGGSAVDASGEPWDPDLARQLLAEAGYPDGVPAVFVFPDGDVELAGLAQDMALDLVEVGISAELVPVPRGDMGSYVGTLAMAGEPVLWLVRR
jgi:hypothetical protein